MPCTVAPPGHLLPVTALPVLAVAAFYVVQALRRKQYAARFTDLSLLASVAPRRP